MMFKKNKKEEAWGGMESTPTSGQLLKNALAEKKDNFFTLFKQFIYKSGQGISSHVLTAGEIILDFSQTKVGRAATISISLLGVFLLIS